MKYRLICADVMEGLGRLEDESVDAIVTDPPYGIEFMGRDWDTFARERDYHPRGGYQNKGILQGYGRGGTSQQRKNYRRKSNGNFQEFALLWATEAIRVLKPGGHILAFGGTRTYHRMVVAIEDAGFEVRDQISYYSSGEERAAQFWASLTEEQQELFLDVYGRPSQMDWIYGSGFPKNLDVSKAIDGLSMTGRSDSIALRAVNENRPGQPITRGNSLNGHTGFVGAVDLGPTVKRNTPASAEATEWQGWGTALKPSHEPIVLARKPLSESNVAANVLKHGTGAINIYDCRINPGEPISGGGRNFDAYRSGEGRLDRPPSHRNAQEGHANGRWPANAIFDEAAGALLDAQSGTLKSGAWNGTRNKNVFGSFEPSPEIGTSGDSGGASRFFYTAKASKADRDPGNNHPTVKPTDLIRYLVELITPPGGTVLDPFMGSGTTGIVTVCGGRFFIGIEQSQEYVDLARRRIRDSAPLLTEEVA